MTLHDVAMDWVAEQTKGIVTHTGHRGIYKYIDGLEPDVVANRNRPSRCHELHEVEVLHLSQNKMKKYQDLSNKKILWIILPKDTSATYTIRVLEQEEPGFKRVWTGRRY